MLLYLKGEWLKLLSREAEAIKALERSVANAPLHAQSWSVLHGLYRACGHLDEATRVEILMTELFGFQPD
jgi:hypothetical protein